MLPILSLMIIGKLLIIEVMVNFNMVGQSLRPKERLFPMDSKIQSPRSEKSNQVFNILQYGMPFSGTGVAWIPKERLLKLTRPSRLYGKMRCGETFHLVVR